MEKILINYNESEHASFVAKVQQALNEVQEYVLKLNESLPMPLTGDLFTDVLNSNGERTANAIIQAITDQLEQAGIRSKGIRDAAIEAEVKAFYTIFREWEQQRTHHTDYLPFFYLKDGEAAIVEDLQEKTKDRFCSYLKSEKAKKIHDAHVVAFEACIKLTDLLPREKKGNLNHFIFYRQDLGEYRAGNVDYNFLANYDELAAAHRR